MKDASAYQSWVGSLDTDVLEENIEAFDENPSINETGVEKVENEVHVENEEDIASVNVIDTNDHESVNNDNDDEKKSNSNNEEVVDQVEENVEVVNQVEENIEDDEDMSFLEEFEDTTNTNEPVNDEDLNDDLDWDDEDM